MKRFTGLLIILFLVLASSQMVLAVSYEPIYKSAKSILATQKQKTTKTKAANQASPAKAATAAKVVKPIQTPLATSLSASVPASASASSCGGRYQECCGSLPRYGTCKSGLYCSPLDGGTCMAKVVASAPAITAASRQSVREIDIHRFIQTNHALTNCAFPKDEADALRKKMVSQYQDWYRSTKGSGTVVYSSLWYYTGTKWCWIVGPPSRNAFVLPDVNGWLYISVQW